jgi:hypothetical protein
MFALTLVPAFTLINSPATAQLQIRSRLVTHDSSTRASLAIAWFYAAEPS